TERRPEAPHARAQENRREKAHARAPKRQHGREAGRREPGCRHERCRHPVLVPQQAWADRTRGERTVGPPAILRSSGDHPHIDRPATADQTGHDGGPPERPPARAWWIADDDLADVPLARVARELLGNVLAGDDDRFSAELFRQAER